MQLDIFILSEISQKERQIPCDITYILNLKHDRNEPNYKTEANSHSEQTCVAKEKGCGDGRTGTWDNQM